MLICRKTQYHSLTTDIKMLESTVTENWVMFYNANDSNPDETLRSSLSDSGVHC